MKKILHFVLLLLSTGLFAQNELGGLYYPTMTSIHNKANRQGDPIYTAEPTISYAGGVSFLHHFNRTRTHGPIRHGTLGSHFRLRKLYRIDLIYSQHHQNFTSQYRKGNGIINTWEGTKRLAYLKLPVMYQVTHPINKHWAISLFAGPQLSTLVRAEGGIVYWKHYADHDYYDLPFDEPGYYKRFTLDAVAGFNMYYRFTRPHLRWYELTAGIRGDWSLTTVENVDAIENNYPSYGQVFNYDKERKNGHNTSVGLVFGVYYIFHLAEHERTRY